MHVFLDTRTHGYLHGDRDAWINKYMFSWIHGRMDTCMEIGMHGYINACFPGYMDAWIPAWRSGCKDT
jgi:hypothetical protein